MNVVRSAHTVRSGWPPAWRPTQRATVSMGPERSQRSGPSRTVSHYRGHFLFRLWCFVFGSRRQPSVAILILCIVAAPLFAASSAEAGPPSTAALRFLPPGTAPFPGTSCPFELVASHEQEKGATIIWETLTENVVQARGTIAVPIDSANEQRFTIPFSVPAIEDHAWAHGILRAQLLTADETFALASTAYSFPMLGGNPFASRKTELTRMDIVVFDPAGDTVEALRSVEVPHRVARTLEAALAMNPGLLLIGEGLSLNDYRDGARWLSSSDALSVPSLFLAPSGGKASLPLRFPSERGWIRARLENRHFALMMDKRFGPSAWGEANIPVRGGFTIMCSNPDSFSAEFRDEPGWAWIELETADGVRASLSAFDVIGRWNRTPVSRWMLWEMLQRATHTMAASEQGGIPPERK
jgi:hypothetical protein